MRCVALLLVVTFFLSHVYSADFPESQDNEAATRRFLARLNPKLRRKLEKFKEENQGREVDEAKFAKENLSPAELQEIQDALMMSIHPHFGEAVDDAPNVFAEAKAKGEKITKKEYTGKKVKSKNKNKEEL